MRHFSEKESLKSIYVPIDWFYLSRQTRRGGGELVAGELAKERNLLNACLSLLFPNFYLYPSPLHDAAYRVRPKLSNRCFVEL